MDTVIEILKDKIKVLTTNGTPQDRYTNGVLDGLRIAIEVIENNEDNLDSWSREGRW